MEPPHQGRIAGEEGAVPADEGGNALRRRERPFPHQGEMDPDVRSASLPTLLIPEELHGGR